MRDKNKVSKVKTTSKTKKNEGRSHEYETMSQIQNRYGNGRKHNGSDGSRDNSNFSNR